MHAFVMLLFDGLTALLLGAKQLQFCYCDNDGTYQCTVPPSHPQTMFKSVCMFAGCGIVK
jgi:hypothetical protein